MSAQPETNAANSLAEIFASNGCLDIRQMSKWSGRCVASLWIEVKAGRLPVIRIGRRTLIVASDALAWRDSFRSAA